MCPQSSFSVCVYQIAIAQLVLWTLITGLEVHRTSVVQRELGVWTTGAQNVKGNIYYRGFSFFGESVLLRIICDSLKMSKVISLFPLARIRNDSRRHPFCVFSHLEFKAVRSKGEWCWRWVQYREAAESRRSVLLLNR